MATAAPLAPVAAPHGKGRANICRSKQREQLDIALLCNKLEAHKRESEAAKRRQQEYEAARKGLFVPRSAARQFTATATPLKDDLDPSKLRWNSKDEAMDSNNFSEGTHLNPKQKCAALRMGMTENEVIAAATTMHNPDIHRLPQFSSRRGSKQENEGQAATQRRRSGSRDLQADSGSEDVETAAGPYRPGDSAKRRMLHERHQDQISPRGGSFDIAMIGTIPTYRLRRDELNEMPYDMPMPSEGGEVNESTTRPKLGQYDRNNWAQQSQCGDDFRRTLRLPLLQRRAKAEESSQKRPESSGVAGRRDEQLQTVESRRASDSLVADAVKLIKKDEKRRRHESLKAFFKRS